MHGKSTVGVGLQYGDEGKIRIFDKVVDADYWARYNGFDNAGHHLEVGDFHIITHAVPSGIKHKAGLYVGTGCVVNPDSFYEEVEGIERIGINVRDRLFMHPKTSLIQPHHLFLDGIHGKGVGTTGKGGGPCYADQATRMVGDRIKNIQLAGYLSDPSYFDSMRDNLEDVVQKYKLSVNVSQVATNFDAAARRLEQFMCDPLFLLHEVKSGKDVFFESANGCAIDKTHGTAPFVTSSRPIAANAYVGGDLPVKYHTKTFGVGKAIMSRVGWGPFVSEFGGRKSEEHCMAEGGYKHKKEVEQKMFDRKSMLQSEDLFNVGVGLRMLRDEYGATTKRPRRIGSFDLVQLKHMIDLNGVDELYVTKFDCLFDYSQTSLPGIPMVVAYKVNGISTDKMPSSTSTLYEAKPVIEYFPHLPHDISKIRDGKKLPGEAKELIQFISDYVGVPIKGIGVGPKRNQYISL